MTALDDARAAVNTRQLSEPEYVQAAVLLAIAEELRTANLLALVNMPIRTTTRPGITKSAIMNEALERLRL